MSCRLTSNILKTDCEYEVAGVKAIYLYNYDSGITYTPANPKGDPITEITLVGDAKAFRIEPVDYTASWADDVTVNGNNGKYRNHVLNFVIGKYDYDILKEGDALSLGKFVAVVVDNKGNCVVLGRNNGLSATSFNYASGAAAADANGWTVVLEGAQTELGQLLESEEVIKSHATETTVTP